MLYWHLTLVDSIGQSAKLHTYPEHDNYILVEDVIISILFAIFKSRTILNGSQFEVLPLISCDCIKLFFI